MINILAADKLFQSPQVYSTFLLWLLAELYERMPEVGAVAGGDRRRVRARLQLAARLRLQRGAYFSGISTGSLHGWVWFAAAFAGSILGVRLRAKLGFSG